MALDELLERRNGLHGHLKSAGQGGRCRLGGYDIPLPHPMANRTKNTHWNAPKWPRRLFAAIMTHGVILFLVSTM